jgi:parvulin-like peptidyl-prolyl isomerase
LKRYLAVAAVAAVLFTACSGSADVVATVNGTDLAASDVESLVFDTGEDFGDTEFIQLLDLLVQWTAVADAAEEQFGLDPTDEEVATEVERIYAERGPGMDFEEYLETENISEDGLDLYAEQLLIGEGVLAELETNVGEPTEAEAIALLQEDPNSWTEVCAAHILVATEDEASAVLERLDAGEDFAELAIELSTDTGSGAAGGDLGCTTPANWVPEFAAATMTAEIGDVVGPIESQFGFHIIRVDSRTEAASAEVIEAVSSIRISEAIDDWYVTSVGAADVEIAEEWGTWETDPFPGIVPPPELVP